MPRRIKLCGSALREVNEICFAQDSHLLISFVQELDSLFVCVVFVSSSFAGNTGLVSAIATGISGFPT
jgi:hypothetical protein